MKRITEKQVKQIYWKKARGSLFSSEFKEDSFNPKSYKDVEATIPIRVATKKDDDEITGVLVARIYFDGNVYEALNYGFAEESIFVEPQLGNFLEALTAHYPDHYFESYDYSIIDVSLRNSGKIPLVLGGI